MFLNDPLAAPRPGGGRPALVSISLAAMLLVAFGLAPRPVFSYLERKPAQGTADSHAAASSRRAVPAADGPTESTLQARSE
jgi:hypothetical protein